MCHVMSICICILVLSFMMMKKDELGAKHLNFKFNNWNDCRLFIDCYQNEVKQNFNIAASKTLSNFPVEGANIDCKYNYVTLHCKYGMKRHNSRNQGERNTRTTKLGCPAFLHFTLTDDLQNLQLTRLNVNHEMHDGTQQFFEIHRENRQIKDPALLEKMKKLISLKTPVSSIQTEFSTEHGIELIAKDVQNKIQGLKNKDDEKLSRAISVLQNEYNAVIDILCEKVNDQTKPALKGLFFQTQVMKDAYLSWPNMVFVDGKYNLLKNKMITILMCVQDGQGHTHIIGVGLIVSETKSNLKSLFETLKSRNPDASKNTKVFMTDNDLTERMVIKEVFSTCLLLICEFHILKIFARRITTTAMGITLIQRYHALELLDKMVKSNSEEEYNSVYAKFCETSPVSIQQYFNTNYHPIREQWVRYYMSNGNYGNYTNNPVESQNARLGKLCPHPTTLVQFVREFFKYQDIKNKALKHSLSVALYSMPVNGFTPGTTLYCYERTLTPKAFQQVAEQLSRRRPMTFFEQFEEEKVCWIRSGYTILKVLPESCDCIDFKSDGLPCRHIFAWREHLELKMFDINLCPAHYTLEYTTKNHPTLKSTSHVVCSSHYASPTISSSNKIKMRSISTTKPTDYKDRLKIMTEKVSALAATGSLATGEVFQERLKAIDTLQTLWRKNITTVIQPKDTAMIDLSDLSLEDSNAEFSLDNVDSSIIMPTPVKVIGRPSGAFKSTVQIKKNQHKTVKNNIRK